MDNDDQPVGRILTRREVLALLGGASAAALLARATDVLSAASTLSVAQATPGAENLLYLPLVRKAGEAPGATPTMEPGATPTFEPTATLTAEATATPTASVTSEITPTKIAVGPTTTPTAIQTTVPVCVVRPAQTEGPYFVDEMLNRSDIRSDPSTGAVKDGALLQLTFRVSKISGGCVALQGVTVDIWHCDALGVYSDVSDPGFNTSGQKWLRGYQATDPTGAATFITIYPGWYSGRAVHIHFKIRARTSTNQSFEFTSQLYFNETLTDQVHAQSPYSVKGRRNTFNSTDGIYRNGGDQLLLDVTTTAQGYAATFDIGLNIA